MDHVEVMEQRGDLRATYSTVLKSFIGAGILALPNAFSRGGVVGSGVLLLIVGFAANRCIHYLIVASHVAGKSGAYAKHGTDDFQDAPSIWDAEAVNSVPTRTQKTGSGNATDDESEDVALLEPTQTQNIQVRTFADVGHVAFGDHGRLAANLTLVFAQVGFTLAYCSFIGHNLHDVMPSISRVMWTVLIGPPLIGLVQIRNFAYIAPISNIGNIAYMFSITIFFYYGFADHCCIPKADINWFSAKDLPIVFGTIAFGMEGVATAIPAEHSMRRKEFFMSVLNAVMATVVVVYMVFSVLNYMFYGASTKAVITVNLGKSGVATSVKLLLSLVLLLTYPIQMFPVSLAVDSGLRSLLGLPPAGSSNAAAVSTLRKNSFFVAASLARVALVVFTIVVSSVVADFGLIVALVGSLTNGLLAFVLPSLFYLKICKPKQGYTFSFVVLPLVYIIFGLAASVAGLVFTLTELAAHGSAV